MQDMENEKPEDSTMSKAKSALSPRQWETLLSITKRGGNNRESVDTHRYLWGTLTALERRGLVEFENSGFQVAITEAGNALVAADAEVVAERLATQRTAAAWKHREALYKIVKAPNGALAGEYSALGLEAAHDLLNAGLIEHCMAASPEGSKYGPGVGVGGVRLTDAGKVEWEKVARWVTDPVWRALGGNGREAA